MDRRRGGLHTRASRAPEPSGDRQACFVASRRKRRFVRHLPRWRSQFGRRPGRTDKAAAAGVTLRPLRINEKRMCGPCDCIGSRVAAPRRPLAAHPSAQFPSDGIPIADRRVPARPPNALFHCKLIRFESSTRISSAARIATNPVSSARPLAEPPFRHNCRACHAPSFIPLYSSVPAGVPACAGNHPPSGAGTIGGSRPRPSLLHRSRGSVRLRRRRHPLLPPLPGAPRCAPAGQQPRRRSPRRNSRNRYPMWSRNRPPRPSLQ
jgi:hypothetical protein